MKQLFLFIFTCFMFFAARAQEHPEVNMIHIISSHTSFPDTGRSSGHIYDSVLYSFKEHYNDSTVLIISPKHLKARKHADLIFWFHGWRNHVDSAAERYQLTRQFISSGTNAVLVLAETARNSPDSYGGKLEQPNVFSGLVGDVLAALKKNKYISKNCTAGNIIIAGHSGAYRVMAYILQNGGVPVGETVLFDALYGQEDKFMNWIKKDTAHRFVSWYTNTGGGTDEVSIQMMKDMKEQNLPFILAEEKNLTVEQLQTNRIVFIHSEREHNDIINNPDNFLLMLTTGNLLKKLKYISFLVK